MQVIEWGSGKREKEDMTRVKLRDLGFRSEQGEGEVEVGPQRRTWPEKPKLALVEQLKGQ
jgi:hypothetical protein